MATLDIVNVSNKKAGSVDLDPSVFEAPVKTHLFHSEVRRQLALRHRGTHSTKNRSAVSGGGAKPWRQKGTGRARQGSSRSPQWAGGGAVFGPVPRSYGHALPKKMRAAALRGALSMRLSEEAMVVVDEIALDGFKTKQVVEILSGLGLLGSSVLIVIADENTYLETSSRNLPGVSTIRVAGLNVYDVLRHKHLLLTKEAVEKVEARLAGSAKGEGQ